MMSNLSQLLNLCVLCILLQLSICFGGWGNQQNGTVWYVKPKYNAKGTGNGNGNGKGKSSFLGYGKGGGRGRSKCPCYHNQQQILTLCAAVTHGLDNGNITCSILDSFDDEKVLTCGDYMDGSFVSFDVNGDTKKCTKTVFIIDDKFSHYVIF